MYMLICMIQMQAGKRYSRELKCIEYFWIRSGRDCYAVSLRVLYDLLVRHPPKNHVLQYCMASNISGVIGSAVASR